MSADDRSPSPLSLETLTAQALGEVDPGTRAIVPPLHPSTTYERDADGEYRSGRAYTRPQNPTYDAPERLIARLEEGASALLFASGMAAGTAVFQALLPGDHVVVPRVMYFALRKWLCDFAVPWGLEVDFVHTDDLEALERAMRPGRTRLVWIETPANPTWAITDIAGAARIAHAAGARLAVDSTVATPVFTRPLALGADLVVHSATKYLNGHSDVLAGAVVTARRDPLWQRIRAVQADAGAVLGPFEAWLLLRGMRTLFVRVRQSAATALTLARHLEGHRSVIAVHYPGLPGHPGHAVAARQMEGGFGAMLSLRVRGGVAGAMAVAARTRVFKRATSLGGVESLIEHRASIEGPSTPVPGDLLRLSIGLETVEDLIADLEAALEAIDAGAPAIAGDGLDEAGLDAVAKVVDERVRPVALDRGADVRLESAAGGRATLSVLGSPGAIQPLRGWIERLVREADPDIETVGWSPGAEVGPNEPGDEDVASAVQSLLDVRVNPSIAAHEGRARVEKVADGVVQVVLEGRCLGCAMADVTVRQGIEPIVREALTAVRGVVDVSDHERGTDPYFSHGKSSGSG